VELNLFFSILFAVGLLFVFLGLDLVITSRTIPLDKRIDTYKQATDNSVPAPKTPDKKTRWGGWTPQSWQKGLADELARANLPLTINEYLSLNTLTTMLGLLVGLALFREALIFILVSGLIGFVAPRWYLRYLQSKRISAFNDQIAGVLTLMANALRSGYGLSQAIETVANESAPPSSIEFKRVIREVAIGLPMETALDNLVRRNPSLDLELVVMAIRINRQSGGNLSEVLDQIASTIRDRVRLEGELDAITAQQRFTALVLTALPPGLMALIYVISPDYISQLWQNTCGLAMLGTGGLLMLIGYLIIRRILVLKF